MFCKRQIKTNPTFSVVVTWEFHSLKIDIIFNSWYKIYIRWSILYHYTTECYKYDLCMVLNQFTNSENISIVVYPFILIYMFVCSIILIFIKQEFGSIYGTLNDSCQLFWSHLHITMYCIVNSRSYIEDHTAGLNMSPPEGGGETQS